MTLIRRSTFEQYALWRIYREAQLDAWYEVVNDRITQELWLELYWDHLGHS